MHHSFDISIAEKFGVNVAIFLNNMAYWIKHNMANEKHFYDGRYWTFNSVKAYSSLFPYWTEKQVRTVLDQCLDNGLIVKGNYNSNKYDQTKWYSLTDFSLKLLNLTNLPNGQIELGKKANRNDSKGKPIPNINTDNKKAFKSYCSSDDEPQDEPTNLFEEFWKHYPRKQKKKETERIWKRKKYDRIAPLLLKDIQERLKTEWKSKEIEYVPLPSTYLNGERWTDEIITPVQKTSRSKNDAFSNWMNASPQGQDYDEQGHALDPFSG